MHRTATGLVVLLLATVFGCDSKPIPPKWVVVNSAAGGFSVSFPEQPKEVTNTAPVGSWTFTNHVLDVTHTDGWEWSAMWADYPPKVMALTTPENVFKNIRNGYERDRKAILSERAVSINGQPASEFEVDVGGGQIHRVRLCMVQNRLYQLMTYAPASSRNHPDVGKFMDSFALAGALPSTKPHAAEQPRDLFPTYGISLIPPATWTPQSRSQATIVAQWAITNFLGANLAQIRIETLQTTDPVLDNLAKSWAETWGGSLLQEETTLDGERAIRIRAEHKGWGIKIVEGVVAMHNGRLFVIAGGVMSGQECRKEVEAIRASWKWMACRHPSEFANDLPSQMPLKGSQLVVRVPAAAVIPDAGMERVNGHFCLHNIVSGKDEFCASFNVLPEDKEADFKQTYEAFRAKTNLAYRAAMDWVKVDPKGKAVMSNDLNTSAFTQDGKDATLIWAMRICDDRNPILVTFTVSHVSPQQMESYRDLAWNVVTSMRKQGE